MSLLDYILPQRQSDLTGETTRTPQWMDQLFLNTANTAADIKSDIDSGNYSDAGRKALLTGQFEAMTGMPVTAPFKSEDVPEDYIIDREIQIREEIGRAMAALEKNPNDEQAIDQEIEARKQLLSLQKASQTGMMPPSAQRFLGQGMFLGAGDEIEAAISAFQSDPMAYLKAAATFDISEPSRLYDERKALIDMSINSPDPNAGLQAISGGTLGSILGARRIAGLIPDFAKKSFAKQGMMVSAPLGAFHGFMSENGDFIDRTTSAAKEAILSTILSGVIGKGLDVYSSRMMSKIADSNKGMKEVAETIKKQGIPKSEAEQTLDNVSRITGGKETIADISEGTGRLAVQAAKKSPYELSKKVDAMTARSEGIPENMLSAYDKVAKTNPTLADELMDNIRQAKVSVSPKFNESLSETVTLDQAGLDALKRARKFYDKAIEEGVQFGRIGLDGKIPLGKLKVGSKIPVAIPNAIKQYGQAQYGKNYAEYTSGTRVGDWLKSQNIPKYNEALKESGDYLSNSAAFKAGEGIFDRSKVSDKALKEVLSKLKENPSSVDSVYFKTGVRAAAEKRISGAPINDASGKVEASRLVGSKFVRSRLESALGKSKETDDLINQISIGGDVAATNKALATARTEGMDITSGRLLESHGDPSISAHLRNREISAAAKKIFNRKEASDEAVANISKQVGDVLLEQGKESRKILSKLYKYIDKLDAKERSKAYMIMGGITGYMNDKNNGK